MDKSSEAVTNLVDDRKHHAALAMIQERVKGGVRIDDIRDTRYTGNPPIWVRMLDDGHIDAVRFAILSGADVNARSCIGKTALSLAAENGLQEIVDLLIGHGADPNASCGERDDPLSAAAKKGHLGIVESLLAAGADVHRTNEYGHTTLMAAAISGDEAIMRKLVSAGASATAQDKFGRTAMYYAVANKRTAAIDYLTTLGAGAARPEKLQAIVSFSRRPMSKWDAFNLRDEIERSQNEMGRMTDSAVFRAQNIAAGDSLDDEAYIYAHLRECLADLGGHELISRCYVYDFRATNGNYGKYVVLLDREPTSGPQDAAPSGSPINATDFGSSKSTANVKTAAQTGEAPQRNPAGSRDAPAQTSSQSEKQRRWWQLWK